MYTLCILCALIASSVIFPVNQSLVEQIGDWSVSCSDEDRSRAQCSVSTLVYVTAPEERTYEVRVLYPLRAVGAQVVYLVFPAPRPEVFSSVYGARLSITYDREVWREIGFPRDVCAVNCVVLLDVRIDDLINLERSGSQVIIRIPRDTKDFSQVGISLSGFENAVKRMESLMEASP